MTKLVAVMKLPSATAASVEAGSWAEGAIYHDSTSGRPRFYNGTAWDYLDSSQTTSDWPVGAIIPWLGATIPAGWLVCSGQTISRTTYADLFNVIGTNFGVGNGSTTFHIPNLQEYQIAGAASFASAIGTGNASGANGAGTFSAHSSETHSHTITNASYTEIGHTMNHSHTASVSSSTDGSHSHGSTTDVSNPGQSHTHTRTVAATGSTASFNSGATSRSSSGHTHTAPTISTDDHDHTVTLGATDSQGGHSHSVGMSLATATTALGSASPSTHTHTATPSTGGGHTHTTHSYKTTYTHFIIKT